MEHLKPWFLIALPVVISINIFFLSFIALIAGAAIESPDLRDPTENMISMTTQGWSPMWRASFLTLITHARGMKNQGVEVDTEIDYSKSGKVVKVSTL